MSAIQRKREAWFWSAIADWMIANPDGRLQDCAAHIGRTPTTLSIIINSDMFKAYLEQRKDAFRMMHDGAIIERTTKVAIAGLDAIADQLTKRRDKIPMSELNAVTGGALKMLGYGVEPKNTPPTVQINGNANVILPVSREELEAARGLMRQVQASKALPSTGASASGEQAKLVEAELVNVPAGGEDDSIFRPE